MGTAVLAPAAAQADPLPVDGGSLSWGVKSNWRSYVTGFIAQGTITADEPATVDADHVVTWGNGVGSVDFAAGTGTVTFAGSMVSRGHEGHNGSGTYGLDQHLVDPQIVLTSPTQATLSYEVTQPAFEPAFAKLSGERVVIADLAIPAGKLVAGERIEATGTFSASSAPVFGGDGNFTVGSATDPVVFTIPVSMPEATKTSTTVAASKSSVAAGDSVELTATVSPADATGSVVFENNGAELPDGSATLVDGVAKLNEVRLPEGKNVLSARFVPANAQVYGASSSVSPATVEVTSTAQTATVTLSTTPTGTVVAGAAVELRASVVPAEAAGRIQFNAGATVLGDPVVPVDGVATLTTAQLSAGDHELTASFVPTDTAAWASAVSAPVKLTVTSEEPGRETTVRSGDLTWSVKDTWWNYVHGMIANGNVTAKAPATLVTSGEAKQAIAVTWSDATSATPVNLVRGTGAITYKGTMLSLGHAGDYPGGFGLRQELRDPQIVLTSPTTATLSAEVTQTSYAAFPAKQAERVVIADLRFPAAQLASGKVTTTSATFTRAGAALYGGDGNYKAGGDVAPVSFSVNSAAAQATSTTLSASARSITAGDSLTLRATVTPQQLTGSIEFFEGNKSVGKASVKNGAAELTISRMQTLGNFVYSAKFTPSDDGYAHSVGTAQVKVVPLPPAPPAAADGKQQAGALVWGVSAAFADYTTGPIAKGSVYTSGVGNSAGAYVFPQATGGSWNSKTQTGSVQYSGTVRFTGHKGLLNESFANPVITVTDGAAGTISAGGRSFPLNLAAAGRTLGSNGEITFTGVPVNGQICGGGSAGSASGGGCFNADRLSFTVGAVSAVTYGTTVEGKDAKAQRVAAAVAPATTGIRVLSDASKLTPGGRIELEASGFESNEEDILVVLYSEPLVLDAEAKADRNGTVRWSGTLPEDISLGEHTMTFQGSKNAGAVIKIVEKSDTKPVAATKRAAETSVTTQQAEVADGVIASSGLPVWSWWAIAGGLLVLAACTTTLVIRQRRSA